MVEIRYLVTFGDDIFGMRRRDTPLKLGDKLDHYLECYTVVRVEQPPSKARLGRAWAERDTAERASSAGARSAAE